ncbi:MAG: M14 family metallopeptidase [Bacteroidetes bacterium]|nr:M14 family metallopeptidase [Bacteroidota bacterium]
MRCLLIIDLLFLTAALPSAAQQTLLTPADYLGYELGERFTRHHEVEGYVKHVSEESPNVELTEYGKTNEGRALLLAFISTPENLARLEEIRTNNLKIAGLLDGDLVGEALSIVWLSYNVHGNESVSSEAAMATLYDLANTSDPQTQPWLANTIVLLDPMINPDGRDRYVNWYNQAVGATNNVAPDAQEHSEPGPGGRTNHYNFDLNRDWSWLTQKETQARIRIYNEWMPHVHVDFHEQGVDSPYYFAPAAKPLHAVITDWQVEFQTIIGRNHARYFDQNGWLYFTKQQFDLYYPGYGDTYPMYNGAIGMTYEQGGGARAGLGIITAEGDTLTLAGRIAHHYTTGLSTVEMVSVHHDRVVDEFKEYFDRANSNVGGEFASYVVKADPEDGRIDAMALHLQELGIRVGTVSEGRGASGYSYRSGDDTTFRVTPGDLVISAHQPRSTMLNVLFEPISSIPDSVTYDITAWALPYAYDVDAYATSERIEPDSAYVQSEGNVSVASGQPYAYLIRWKDVSDAKFLSTLLQKKIKVRYSEKAFEIEGGSYDAGTLIVTRAGNETFGEKLGNVLSELALRHNQTVTAVSTGFVDSGADFGSSDVHYIKPPKVAVVRGNGGDWASSGQIWHFFEQQIGYPVTMMTPDRFKSVDLSDYELVVLPEASYSELLNEDGLGRLTSWIRAGGRLIAVGRAASFFMGKKNFALTDKKKKKPKEKKDEDEEDNDDSPDSDTLKVYGERDRDRETERNQGSIYQVSVDNTHPLAFGFGKESFVLKRGTMSPAYLSGSGSWNVGVLKVHSLVSGQVGFEVKEKIEESLAYGVQQMGKGSIVYLIDNPLFRGFWYSGQLLMANAVFLVGQ